MADDEVTYCNARLRQNGHDPDELPKREPGLEHAGDGYCQRQTTGRRCRMHGGNGGRPASHGLYSFRREELRERLSQAEGMESPGDLWTEVAVLRTLLSEYLEDVDEVDGDVLQDVTKIQKELRRTVDNIHEMLMRTRPTEAEVERLTDTFAQIIRAYVPECDRDEALNELERAVRDGAQRALESGR